MKCGECNHWNPVLQGETYSDLFQQHRTFGKVIGRCEKGLCIPMFDFEDCKKKDLVEREMLNHENN